MISLTGRPSHSPDAGASASLTPRWWLGLAAVMILGGLYLWSYLDRGWVPHDEGTLAQSAERVLQGETPHRDFDDVYTGGLSYLNAALFRLGGLELTTIRRGLFVGFLVWLPAVYFIASRWASLPLAVLVTLLAVSSSVPNYSAAIPSWFNLFLATLGLAALLRYRESGSRRWILATGVCAGLSILAKIVGLYFVAAVGLILIAWEQQTSSSKVVTAASAKDASPRAGSAKLYSGTLVAALAGYCLVTLFLYGRLEPQRSVVAFVLPAVIPALLLVERELRTVPAAAPKRLAALLRLATPFLVGLAAILLPFLGLFAARGALGDLLHGIFVAPTRRLDFAAQTSPSLATLWTTFPPFILLLWAARQPERTRWWTAIGLALPLASLLVWADDISIYQPVFYSFRWLVLLAVIVAAWRWRDIWQPVPGSPVDSPDPAALFAVLAVAGLCNLVQYPFAAPIYFLYVAPLGVLTLLAVISFRSTGARPVFTLLAMFYLVFCSVWVNRGFIYWMGIRFVEDTQTETLDIDRGGLRVSSQDQRTYKKLTQLIRERAQGDYIYATPDCPEVYFLAGLRNPTSTLFDFFDRSADRSEQLLETLEAKQVRLVVLNRKPDFSGPPPRDLVVELRRRFPASSTIGDFEVRWQP